MDIRSSPYPVREEEIVLCMRFIGEPVSKARARFTRAGGIYTPEKTRAYEEQLQWIMRTHLRSREPDTKGRFALRCIFYRGSRQRIDCDNLIKTVSDAATGQVWYDDYQVMEIVGKLFLADNNPRAEILIHRVEDSAQRLECPVCGKAEGVEYGTDERAQIRVRGLE